MARPIASFVVAMEFDGRVSSQGSIIDALPSDSLLGVKISEEEHDLKKADGETGQSALPREPQTDGKLIVEEEVEQGHISWRSRKFNQSWGSSEI
jgi:hypothetical protein